MPSTRRSAIHSIWPLPLAAFVLLAPNGMNRHVATVAALDAPAVAARIATQIKPYLGTIVAAKCVERDGSTTYVDPDYDCHFGAARSDVIVVPDPNIAEGTLPPQRYAAKAEAGTDAAGQQCVALEGLVDTIDLEVKRPGPPARRGELFVLRQKAVSEQHRLLC